MIRFWNNSSIIACHILLLATLGIPRIVFADGGYVSLLGLPLDSTSGSLDMTNFVQMAMRMLIIAAALVAVIKIILAGAKYVLSGIVTDKESAKKDIRSALIGLLIILAAVVILRTINPSLTNLPALEPIGNNIPWDDILPDDPIQDDIDRICGPATGSCTIKNCDEILPTSLGIIISAGGLPIVTNSVVCSVWCPWFGGVRISRTPLIPDSGRCIYPNNPEAVEEARERARQDFAERGIDANVVTFIDPDALDLFDDEDSELYYEIENQIDSIPSSLGVSSIDDITGVFDLTQTELDALYAGASDLAEYESVLNRVIQGTCESTGGTRVYPMSRSVTHGGGTRYFCI